MSHYDRCGCLQEESQGLARVGGLRGDMVCACVCVLVLLTLREHKSV